MTLDQIADGSGGGGVSYPSALKLVSGANETTLSFVSPATDPPSYSDGTATIAWSADHWAISGDDAHYTGTSTRLTGTYTGGLHDTSVTAPAGGGSNVLGLGL